MSLLPAKVNRFKIELGLCVSISNDFLKGNFSYGVETKCGTYGNG
jgi:hypothetical protein